MKRTQNSSRAPRNSLRWKNGNREEFVSPLNAPPDKLLWAVAFTLFLSGRTSPCSLRILFWSAITEVKPGLKKTIVWLSPIPHFRCLPPCPSTPTAKADQNLPWTQVIQKLPITLSAVALAHRDWMGAGSASASLASMPGIRLCRLGNVLRLISVSNH